MKRALIALITAIPLVVGVTSAQADGFPGWPGTGGTGTPQVAVAGTVVSTSGTSIVANAYVVTPPSQGDDSQGDEGGLPGFGSFGFSSFGSGSFGSGGFPSLGGFGGFQNAQFRANDMTMPTPPTTTQVTIQTNTSTMIHIGGMGEDDSTTGTTPPTVSDLVAGTRFIALFPGSSSDPITTIVNNPATAIFAEIPKQFYAFVGTVTGTTAGTSTTPGSVTVTVSDSMPSGLFATGSSATFTVSDGTLIIGGSGGGTGFSLRDLFGGSLSSVSTGDMVTGGLIGPGGLTATQVEATPLMFMLDFPAPPASSSSSAAQHALKETMNLLHGGKVKLGKKHAKRSHHSKRSKHSRRSARH